MTQEQKIAKAEQSYKLVQKSIQSLEDGMKDKDAHINLLELTIGRLMWIIKESVDTSHVKEVEEPVMGKESGNTDKIE